MSRQFVRDQSFMQLIDREANLWLGISPDYDMKLEVLSKTLIIAHIIRISSFMDVYDCMQDGKPLVIYSCDDREWLFSQGLIDSPN